jgi:hypothetical protein
MKYESKGIDMIEKTESQAYSSIKSLLENKFYIQSLFRFIKKNKFIPEFLASVNPDDQHLKDLLLAIETGDSDSNIFCHPDCHLYLLYFIKEEKIPFWQGITVYTYLSALMALSDKQALRKEDQNVKLSREFTVQTLSQNKKITVEGELYLKNCCTRMEKEGYVLNYDEMTDFIVNLPASEQWLLKVPFQSDEEKNGYDRLTSILSARTPFLIFDKNPQNETSNLYLPSLSLINYFLKKISPLAMKMLPVFGNVGLASLRELHSQGFHPASLYSNRVQSNPKDADGNKCGPLIMLVHDISHTYWASKLTAQQRELIFNHFLPQIDLMLCEAQKQGDRIVEERLKDIIQTTVDLGSDLHQFYTDPSNRLERYLSAIFLHSYDFAESFKLGDVPGYSIIFLANRFYNTMNVTEFDEVIWKKTIFNKHFQLMKVMKSRYVAENIAAMINLATNSEAVELSEPESSVSAVDWQEWQRILEKTNDSATIWQIAKTERYEELLTLITHYNLKFFPPYLPLTEEKLYHFKKFIQDKLSPVMEEDYQINQVNKMY